GCVPRGFGSTFRDWAAECTGFASQVIEMALAHAIGDKVEAAYRRGDLWEVYVERGEKKALDPGELEKIIKAKCYEALEKYPGGEDKHKQQKQAPTSTVE